MSKLTRTWMVLVGLVVFFGIASRLLGVTDKPEETLPHFSATDVQRAEASLSQLVQMDGIRDISQPHTVIVGNGFALAEFETKRSMLIQAMVVRQSRGLSTHFILREPMNHREIGYFQDGRLQLK